MHPRHRLPPLLGLWMGSALTLGGPACRDADGPTGRTPDPADDSGSPDSGEGPDTCGSAGSTLPEGLTELSWDDGVGSLDVLEAGFTLVGEDLGAHPLHEAVRFALDRPARIWGFAIQYGRLPASGPVVAGLYPDFGYNGFDFYQWTPLWQGDRCATDLAVGEWATFALDTPVEVEHPGLIYVAQLRAPEAEDNPAWLFDATYTGDGSCAQFDDCHSALNMPDMIEFSYGGTAYYFYNGLSSSLPYDYMVRLYVEYLDAKTPFFAEVPEVTLSSRQAWGDYDGDGDDDLFTNGPLLLQNNGDGTFTNATDAAGISAMGIAASGGVWGDYDNDGHLDLLVFAESGSVGDSLLHNNGDGTFSDVTVAAGLLDVQTDNDCAGAGYTTSPTAAAAWLDLDNDGFLDIYLSNFICWTDYSYYTDTVFRSRGDGTFEDWTGEAGFLTSAYAGRGASPADADGDGDVDLLVNNYVLQRNLFFENNGDGTVTESSSAHGLAGEPSSTGGLGYYYGHTIGTAWGDLDSDGDLDVVAANLAHPRFFDFSNKTQILINDGLGDFVDLMGEVLAPVSEAGLRYQETYSVPALGDFDNNGTLDLVLSAVYDGRPTDFYWGNGDGTFTLASDAAGITRENGWGMAVADMNNDGDLDLAAYGGLYENTQTEDALGSWLQLRLVGDVSSNRAAIGATAHIFAGDQQWTRHVSGGNGQGNQDSLTLLVGLGSYTTVDRIEVRFPGPRSGETVIYTGPFDANQRLWLYESGTWTSGWLPPTSH